MHTRHWPRHVLAAPPAPFLWHLRHGTKGNGGRAREKEEGEGKFYTGDGWRAALTETEDERAFARRERDAKETGQRDGDYATGLFWVGGKTYCLRTKHLPQKPSSHPLLPCPFWPCLVLFVSSTLCTPTSLVSIHSRSCH